MQYDLTQQSAELTHFYRVYASFMNGTLSADFPDFPTWKLTKHHGICLNANLFADFYGYDGDTMRAEIHQQCEDAGLPTAYPLNNGDGEQYRQECLTAAYDNPVRRQWVLDHVPTA